MINNSISNLQLLKKKLEMFKKLNVYGNCLPCKQIKEIQSCDCTALPAMQDCLEFLQAGYRSNGIYRLHGPSFNHPIVYCDQKTQGGGWTVFQRRKDGSVDFQKTWKDYELGFGKLNTEFWLGNQKLHDLTKPSFAPKKSQLLINMHLNGAKQPVYAKYAKFAVGDERSKYLLTVEGASGTITEPDKFLYHNNTRFSTFDADNDEYDYSCSKTYGGLGW